MSLLALTCASPYDQHRLGDLLPAGCEACDCVMLEGEAPDPGCACELARSPREHGWWLALGLLGIGVGLRRRPKAHARDHSGENVIG